MPGSFADVGGLRKVTMVAGKKSKKKKKKGKAEHTFNSALKVKV